MANFHRWRALKQKRNKKPVKEERICPTAERIFRGDLEVGEDGVYRAVYANAVDDWYGRGLLGPEPKSNDRYWALIRLVGLAADSNLISSQVANWSQVGQSSDNSGSEEECALDVYRYLIRQCSRKSQRLLSNLCLSPTSKPFVDIIDVQQAADELVDAEKRYENEKNGVQK